MNKDLKFLLKRAFDAGTMYEATLSEECSFNEFIKYVESQQLSICDVVSSLPTKEEILKQARKEENYIGNECDIIGAEKTGKFHGFLKGVEWLSSKIK